MPVAIKVATGDMSPPILPATHGAGAAYAQSPQLLVGADVIAEFLFPGDPRGVRRIYHFVSESEATNPLPVFRVGRLLCARPAALLEWIRAREAEALAGGR